MKRVLVISALIAAVLLPKASWAAGSLVRVYVRPGHMSLRPGMTQKFEAYGLDMFDNEVPITEPLTWSTSAGTITQDGVFTAGRSAGLFLQGVKVTTPSGLKGVALTTVVDTPPEGGYVLERAWGDHNPACVKSLSALAIDANDVIHAIHLSDLITQFDTDGRYINQIGLHPAELGAATAIAFYKGDTYLGYRTSIAKLGPDGGISSQWSSPAYGKPGYWASVTDMAIDSQGYIYILDSGSAVVRKFDLSGRYILSWGGRGADAGRFNWPRGICVDKTDNVYVVDGGNDRIQKFNSNGSFLAAWSSFGAPYGALHMPNDIVCDADGNLFISSDNVYSVIKVTPNGTALAGWQLGDDRSLSGIAVDSTGCFYTCNPSIDHYGITKRDQNGNILARWATSVPKGSLCYADALAITPEGIVCESAGEAQRFDSSGNWLGSWTVRGEVRSLAADELGHVYASYYGGALKCSLTGAILARWDLAKTGDQSPSPYGVAVSANGDVYIADEINNQISRFAASGSLISQWGSHGTANGQFQLLHDIDTDRSGNIYAADLNNRRIQKFDATGNYLGQWATMRNTWAYGLAIGPNGDIFSGEGAGVSRYTPSGVRVAQWGDTGGVYPLGGVNDVAVDKLCTVYAITSWNRICKFASTQEHISAMKASRDGEFVCLTGQVVVAGSDELGDCFYIESDDRSCGIRVIGASAVRGSRVTVAGVLTTVDGERAINASSISAGSSDTIDPIALTNKSLGGADLNFDPNTGLGQRGVEDGVGANNVGLLVTTTGKVTGTGSDFFYVDDGTHARDGSAFVGVRVLSRTLTKPEVGSYVSVTGISRINKIGERYFRAIAPRQSSDIKLVN